MLSTNGLYIGVSHWTHDAALIREFQRAWNKREIAKRQAVAARAELGLS